MADVQRATRASRRAELLKAVRSGTKTALEQRIADEEVKEKKEKDLQFLQGLAKACKSKGGEPDRFEQAPGEVYCWWQLPESVKAGEIKVESREAGQLLLVEVRGHSVFEKELFAPIRPNDIVWYVEDGTLHLTLSKQERSKLWEQLSKLPASDRDTARQNTSLQPLTADERIAMFREMVNGDDGQDQRYDELDPETRQLVDALRLHRHARATGDDQKLALAESELDELGRMVI
mmetsp:Transcript_22179/g.50696  ORF Transcript_22179/g.50696 Transcript_22179/m.50696 type:complete len:234 (-) Transcript_22179:32-733(-)